MLYNRWKTDQVKHSTSSPFQTYYIRVCRVRKNRKSLIRLLQSVEWQEFPLHFRALSHICCLSMILSEQC